jgi:hypothetical protein
MAKPVEGEKEMKQCVYAGYLFNGHSPQALKGLNARVSQIRRDKQMKKV